MQLHVGLAYEKVDKIKLEYMQEFMELAEVKNYSRAAERLFISQSTLSKHIAAIEDELGVHLLNHAQMLDELA